MRGLLETELPKAARSAELGIDEGSIREMIDYAEGYQGFACFPETTVRTAVKQAVSNLRGPISAVLTQLRAGVGADVCSAVEGCQRSILAQVEQQGVQLQHINKGTLRLTVVLECCEKVHRFCCRHCRKRGVEGEQQQWC